MAIAKNTTSSSHAAGATSLSWSHTGGSGSDRLLHVNVGTNSNLVTHDTLTYNGVSLTKQWDSAQTWCRSTGWGLVAPATGANTIAITVSATEDTIFGQAIDYTGVHQTTPYGTSATGGGFTTTPSATVSSAADEVVIGSMMTTYSGTPTSGAGQTREISDINYTSDTCVTDSEIGAASVTMDWTISEDICACGAVPIKPAAAGVTGNPWYYFAQQG